MKQSSHEAVDAIGSQSLLLLHFKSEIDVIVSFGNVLISTRSVRRQLGLSPRAMAGSTRLGPTN